MDQVEAVIDHFGGKVQLANVLGVSLTAISKWKTYFPMGRAYQIQVITDGKFKAIDLMKPKGVRNG